MSEGWAKKAEEQEISALVRNFTINHLTCEFHKAFNPPVLG